LKSETAIQPEPETLRLRVHGQAGQPTLIYFPGLHGDWTLVGSFRHALARRVRFVEMTYPRTREWSLDDYAAAIEQELADLGIERGWLLGESFGSQVVWPLVGRGRFRAEGVILAGGFVCHPMLWAVRFAERVAGNIPLAVITRILFGYARVARFRYRHSPEVLASLDEFISRRTELDRQAAVHRLHLITTGNPGSTAQGTRLPVYALTGVLDPVVPWCFVRGWLRKNCPALRDYRIIWHADHNVLGTGADAAARQVLDWMGIPDLAAAGRAPSP
jgi:pimeloyl-ACP methyl ester carboxylesterase